MHSSLAAAGDKNADLGMCGSPGSSLPSRPAVKKTSLNWSLGGGSPSKDTAYNFKPATSSNKMPPPLPPGALEQMQQMMAMRTKKAVDDVTPEAAPAEHQEAPQTAEVQDGDHSVTQLADVPAGVVVADVVAEEAQPELAPVAEEAQPEPAPVVEEAQPEPTPAVTQLADVLAGVVVADVVAEETQPELAPAAEEAQPEPTLAVEEAQPEPTPAVEEAQPEPTPAVEEVQPEPAPAAVEEAQPEPTPAVEASVVEEAQPEPTPAVEAPVVEEAQPEPAEDTQAERERRYHGDTSAAVDAQPEPAPVEEQEAPQTPPQTPPAAQSQHDFLVNALVNEKLQQYDKDTDWANQQNQKFGNREGYATYLVDKASAVLQGVTAPRQDGTEPQGCQSPRAPRPERRQAPSMDLEEGDLDANKIDMAAILTQVARKPPSPNAGAPLSPTPHSPSPQSRAPDSNSRPNLLPPRDPALGSKPCLCLDLDECLVHAEKEKPAEFDYKIDVKVANLGTFEIFFTKRPGLDEFLAFAAQHFELVLFTASMEEYARAVLEKIDPQGAIKHVLARKQCTFYAEMHYVKDLSRLGRPIRDVMLLDDNPIAYLFQPENAIPINSWYDDKQDTELSQVKVLLEAMVHSERSALTTLEQIDKLLNWNRSELHLTRNCVRLC